MAQHPRKLLEARVCFRIGFTPAAGGASEVTSVWS
jgi:hypothetical protein